MKIPEFKTTEDVKSWIEEQGFESVSYFHDFSEAIVGITTDNSLVYSMQKMVESLVKDGVSNEDAIDFLCFTTLRTVPYMPEARPIIIDDT